MSEIIPDRILFVPAVRSKSVLKQTIVKKYESPKEEKAEEPKPIFDIPKVYQPAPLPNTPATLLSDQGKIEDKKFGWRKAVVVMAIALIIGSLGIYFFFG